MNIQNQLAGLSADDTHQPEAGNAADVSNPLLALGSLLPGGLAGGVAVGGMLALLMGSRSTRKLAGKALKYGGTAVLGGLAYKAYGNWQRNQAMHQTRALTDHDIELANQVIPRQFEDQQAPLPLHMVLIKAMIAAAKADGELDTEEHQQLFRSVEKMGLNNSEKALVFDLLARPITVEEIAEAVDLEEHRAEVYLAAYLAIKVDAEAERVFLDRLAAALNLPDGFSVYLEQQADRGIER